MDHIGIDLHKKESQICIWAEEGELLERRVRSTPRGLAEVLGARPRPPMLLDAWRDDYNTVRPHRSLGGRTPSDYARALSTARD